MPNKVLIERKQYMQALRDLKDQNIIKVVTGVRRSGKSTLLEMFAEELRQKGIMSEQIQFYNFEDPDIYAIGDWKNVYDHIKTRLQPKKMNYIFLDEVQNIDSFQRLVDGLFIKKNCDVYITGSNAHLLSGELATLLTGRYIEISILPLQFAEFYDFMLLKSPNLSKIETLAIYILEGGFPEYYNQRNIKQKQADAYMKSVLSTIIEKDIFQRLKIKDKHNFNKIIDFVAVDDNGYTSYYQVAWTTMVPETLERELAPLNAIKDSNPKYLLTTDLDLNPVYNGIRKLNVVDWLLSTNSTT